MFKKIAILVIFFYFLTLFQTSFLTRFNISGYQINLVLLSVILICLFAPRWFAEKDKRSARYMGIISAFIAGFFLSVYSNAVFGFEILVLVCIAGFMKFIIERYVWI
ncbi:hypothetical protein KAW43_03530 [Candidatus Parcubacteria bacterium]|jgi:rod shape-determining protein MreD|nr:hypothetical protein [Candidatus Parcubacteria bacterium]